MEICHTLGITIFVFKVLPSVENITGLFLMNALCLVPAVLKIIFSSRRNLTRLQKLITFILDVAAILCQTSVLIIFKFYPEFDSKTALGFGRRQRVLVEEKTDMFLLYMALSAILVSLSYWQNYAEVRFSNLRLTRFVQTQISEIRKYNSKIYVFVSPIKVLLTFAFAYILLPNSVQKQFSNIQKPINFTMLDHFGSVKAAHLNSFKVKLY